MSVGTIILTPALILIGATLMLAGAWTREPVWQSGDLSARGYAAAYVGLSMFASGLVRVWFDVVV